MDKIQEHKTAAKVYQQIEKDPRDEVRTNLIEMRRVVRIIEETDIHFKNEQTLAANREATIVRQTATIKKQEHSIAELKEILMQTVQLAEECADKIAPKF
ncbi:hypothetical protein N0V86_006153 [Didymella sp. IMI 355093]|nr:hypothetical protein N0V86_006153 [Didymella sp. IMI 355093]